jgi:hypothetical protein
MNELALYVEHGNRLLLLSPHPAPAQPSPPLGNYEAIVLPVSTTPFAACLCCQRCETVEITNTDAFGTDTQRRLHPTPPGLCLAGSRGHRGQHLHPNLSLGLRPLIFARRHRRAGLSQQAVDLSEVDVVHLARLHRAHITVGVRLDVCESATHEIVVRLAQHNDTATNV